MKYDPLTDLDKDHPNYQPPKREKRAYKPTIQTAELNALVIALKDLKRDNLITNEEIADRLDIAPSTVGNLCCFAWTPPQHLEPFIKEIIADRPYLEQQYNQDQAEAHAIASNYSPKLLSYHLHITTGSARQILKGAKITKKNYKKLLTLKDSSAIIPT